MEVSGEKVNSLNERTVARSDCAGKPEGGEKFQSPTVRPTADAAIIFRSDRLIILRETAPLSLSLSSSLFLLFLLSLSRSPSVALRALNADKFQAVVRDNNSMEKKMEKKKKGREKSERRFRVAAETESLSVLANKIY